MMVPAPTSGASKSECFLCTAPAPSKKHGHRECCTAYLLGVIDGLLVMTQGEPGEATARKKLCIDHETLFRELLVIHVSGRGEARHSGALDVLKEKTQHLPDPRPCLF